MGGPRWNGVVILLLPRNTDDFPKRSLRMEGVFRKIIGATRYD